MVSLRLSFAEFLLPGLLIRFLSVQCPGDFERAARAAAEQAQREAARQALVPLVSLVPSSPQKGAARSGQSLRSPLGAPRGADEHPVRL